MLVELLCIAVIYVGAVAYARWVARRRSGSDRSRHYVLVADNHETSIEWYLRALRQFSRRTGTDVSITVRLRDSSDDTGAIVRQLAREDDGVSWQQVPETAWPSSPDVAGQWAGADGKTVKVELANPEDLARLPF